MQGIRNNSIMQEVVTGVTSLHNVRNVPDRKHMLKHLVNSLEGEGFQVFQNTEEGFQVTQFDSIFKYIRSVFPCRIFTMKSIILIIMIYSFYQLTANLYNGQATRWGGAGNDGCKRVLHSYIS